MTAKTQEYLAALGSAFRGFAAGIHQVGDHAVDQHFLVRGLYRAGWAEALEFAAAVLEQGPGARPGTFMRSSVELAILLHPLNLLEELVESQTVRLRVAEREIEALRRELSRRQCRGCGGYGAPGHGVPDAPPCLCLGESQDGR